MSCDHSNQEPTLIIELCGLCAFVADRDPSEDRPEAVYVLMMDTEKAVPKDDLCRHDPIMVFDTNTFVGAGENTEHLAFYDLNDRNVGIWNLRGKDLTLDLVDEETKKALTLDASYADILSLGTLTQDSAKVKKRWATGWQYPGVSSRLTIEHGTVSSALATGPWYTAKNGTALPPKPKGNPIRFNQLVRWSIFAVYGGSKPHFQLSAGPEDFVLLNAGPTKDGGPGRVRISNLCPLGNGNGTVSEDVLAFYPMAMDRVDAADRLILYKKKKHNSSGAGGFQTRPGTDACPPVTGYLP